MSGVALVVDDDPVSVHLLQIILERSGYRVIAARSALDGLELVADLLPDFVILDDMMPGMSGGEMCRRMKADPHLSGIPVILISAGLRIQDRAYVAASGADYALVKPVLPKDVIRAVDTVLGKL